MHIPKKQKQCDKRPTQQLQHSESSPSVGWGKLISHTSQNERDPFCLDVYEKILPQTTVHSYKKDQLARKHIYLTQRLKKKKKVEYSS